MKKTLLLMSVVLGTMCVQSAYSQDSDIKVIPCPKNDALLYVEISGPSAFEIYSYTAKRSGMSINELGGCITNNMNCRPTAFSSSRDVTAVICSYVMSGNTNLPYPQTDPGFSGKPIITCDKDSWPTPPNN